MRTRKIIVVINHLEDDMRASRVIMTSLAALTAGLAMTTPAQAASTVSAAAESTAAVSSATSGRPDCVKVKHTVGMVDQKVMVYNDCSDPVSFVVKIAGFDSPCIHVNPGITLGYKWMKIRKYQGVTFGCR